MIYPVECLKAWGNVHRSTFDGKGSIKNKHNAILILQKKKKKKGKMCFYVCVCVCTYIYVLTVSIRKYS